MVFIIEGGGFFLAMSWLLKKYSFINHGLGEWRLIVIFVAMVLVIEGGCLFHLWSWSLKPLPCEIWSWRGLFLMIEGEGSFLEGKWFQIWSWWLKVEGHFFRCFDYWRSRVSSFMVLVNEDWWFFLAWSW